MILMACVDGRNGMAFNCRRQSRDRALVVPTGACRAVSPHAGNSPWRKNGKGRERAAGRGQVPAGERERRAGLTPPALSRFPR